MLEALRNPNPTALLSHRCRREGAVSATLRGGNRELAQLDDRETELPGWLAARSGQVERVRVRPDSLEDILVKLMRAAGDA